MARPFRELTQGPCGDKLRPIVPLTKRRFWMKAFNGGLPRIGTVFSGTTGISTMRAFKGQDWTTKLHRVNGEWKPAREENELSDGLTCFIKDANPGDFWILAIKIVAHISSGRAVLAVVVSARSKTNARLERRFA